MAAMDALQTPRQVVFTNKARCRDCYRCLRECPIKAIRICDDQAFVEADRCIACGTCVRECPQEAKSFRNDVDHAAALLEAGGVVAASIAPSFAACFGPDDAPRLADALRRLGFSYVAETAIGAFEVARATADHIATAPDAAHVCTACPAVVRYVEQYEPDMAPTLTPVVSPMIAHAQRIKEEQGDETKVVFIGPCVAKKAEAERPELAGLVDCVLTFTELLEWFDQAGITLGSFNPSAFDAEPAGDARFFPLPGGLARTAALDTDLLGTESLAVSSIDDIREAFENVRTAPGPVLIEPLFCTQGCVTGPGMPEEANTFRRRNDVLTYARTHQGMTPEKVPPRNGLTARFSTPPPIDPAIAEAEIQDILERTGKALPEDQLNCGACGYVSCRDQAIAVLRGMADTDMCIPHMRRLAEQRSDRIIETTPNGVVILDDHLKILHMNPAFRKMFQCTDAVLGKPISYLMDPEPFENLAVNSGDLAELTAHHGNYNLVCHQVIYPLRQEGQYVGVFVNITKSVANEEMLKRLRSETVRKARELLEHQVQVAQDMAQFLGESTAQSEELVRNLVSIATDRPRQSGDNWLWDTDIST